MSLNFISYANLEKHITNTINQYGKCLQPIDLKRFNSNIIDPIKLIFDKNVYNSSWEEIIKREILRQRDKSSNNIIGYFHQNIFKYIDGCEIPKTGWDIIFRKGDVIKVSENDSVKRIFVEMKNKHNTMNSSSTVKTYMKMQQKLLDDDDCACFLVEIIAKNSQNIPWKIFLNGKNQKHRRIRRVSIDEFYRIVTGEENAFYEMCTALPKIIEKIVSKSEKIKSSLDNVFEELLEKNSMNSAELALYMLSFKNYLGFKGGKTYVKNL